MSNAFISFCKEIKYEIPEYLVESEILDAVLIDNKFDISINFFSVPLIQDLKNFLDCINNNFAFEITFNLKFINKNYSIQNIYEYMLFSFSFLQNESISNIILKSDLNFDDFKILKINVHSSNKIRILNEKKLQIISNLKKFGFEEFEINLIDLSSHEIIEKDLEEENKKESIFLKDIIKNKGFDENSKANKYIKNKSATNKYFAMKMEDFYSCEETNFIFEGIIFKKDIFKTKTGMHILTFAITDYSEAITIKNFIRNDADLIKYNEINIGVKIKVFGEKTIDTFTGKPILNSKKIEILDDQNQKEDQAKIKRVELSIRTSMSVMDGFKKPEEFLKFAKNLGHKALAIVDLENVQAFPNLYNSAKKIGIKAIYGSTFNAINKDNKFISNLKNGKITEETYVIFDLETTGLSPRFDEIIEFGGIKIKNGKIIEKLQFFMKSSKPISKFTTNLTGITQEMVDAGITEVEGIKKIINFIGDFTLVAHNASFDMGFLIEKTYLYKLKEINNQWIDTLAIAKLLIETSKSYRLEIVCKRFAINYDSQVAHRADYDAEVLSNLWLKFINELNLRDIKTFLELSKADSPTMHNKKFSNQVTILAKNQKGLKELFNLISESSTINYYSESRIFFDELKKSNNLLIGSSGIKSRLLEKVFNGTTQDIIEEIKKYDYIEIPSPHLFVHLINRGTISQENLYFALKDLIYKARQLNKICVAIGDVRYIDENEKILHDVYIKAKGLEGKRHYLFKYKEVMPVYPSQHFLTTSEMIENFIFLNDDQLAFEIVVENTNIISDMIEEIEVIKKKLYTPNFDDSDNKLQNLVYKNAKEIYGEKLPKIVKERIERELEPIIKYGFSVVYWISHVLVAKSLSDGYLVGSRGSVGSSLVATLAKITEVNPLDPHYICTKCKWSKFFINDEYISGYDLPEEKCPICIDVVLSREGQTIPFETFLGFNADKVPDIDLNFSGEYQNIIHKEVKKIFGDSHCFRAGTISTVASTTAFGYARNWREENLMEKSDSFLEFIANQIVGTKRTTGQHPGGIIIIPKEYDVEDFTPVNFPANDSLSEWKTTHFDFHAIHDNVLKLDLLGHDDPTAIKFLQELTGVSPDDISFSDPQIIKMFSSTKPLGIKPEDINGERTSVIGIPEFGTKFVRRMLLTAKVNSFADLVSVSGLSHGTDVWSGNAEELIKQKNLKLKDLISCRDDIMVTLIKKGIDPLRSFQIMEKVRKGMGLIPEEEVLLLKNGIEQWLIDSLKKIKYMFPKAHATAYVMMAWRVAWFKYYYPIEYYAAYFSTRSDHFDITTLIAGKDNVVEKLRELLSRQNKRDENKLTTKEHALIVNLEVANEMFARGFTIQNINLYKSNSFKWVIDKKTKSLIPPFSTLDGLGVAAAESIIEARKNGDFYSIENFSKRTQVNKTIITKMKLMKIFQNLDDTDQTTLF